MSVSEIPFRLEIFFWNMVIDFLSGLRSGLRTNLKTALLPGLVLALAGFSIGLLLGVACLRMSL